MSSFETSLTVELGLVTIEDCVCVCERERERENVGTQLIGLFWKGGRDVLFFADH